MVPFRATYVLLLISLFCSHGYGQNIDSLAKVRVDRGETPGIVVAVYKQGKTTYYAHGFADTETHEKANTKTLFEIGSITKTFTTLMTALLVEQGKISLDDPIQKLLPVGVTVPDRNGKQITIENLATARSGLPRMPLNFAPANPQNPYIDYTQKQLFEFLEHYSLMRDIGSLYEYSNLGMGFLAYALTLQTHKPYSEMVEEMITKPLKMSNTHLNTPTGKFPNRAQGYTGKTPVQAWTWTNESVLAGAGGIISNAEDMIQYLIANLNESGPLGKALAMTHQPRHDAGKDNMQIGMGWHIMDDKLIWHNGGTGGFRSFAGFDRSTGTAVVILTNSNTGADDLGFYILSPVLPLKQIRQPIVVDELVLREYVGEYQITPQFAFTITVKDGSLFGQATGQSAFELFAESPKRFFLKIVDAQIEFVRNDKGQVDKLILYQNGAAQEAKKTK